MFDKTPASVLNYNRNKYNIEYATLIFWFPSKHEQSSMEIPTMVHHEMSK